jgi:hypothetical protein
MSILDSFSGYNKVMVHPDDWEKTTFTTLWGTFMYANMPFSLMNVGVTFQQKIDIVLAKEK